MSRTGSCLRFGMRQPAAPYKIACFSPKSAILFAHYKRTKTPTINLLGFFLRFAANILPRMTLEKELYQIIFLFASVFAILSAKYQPWRCLWFGYFEQITITLPFLLITLHLSHIGLTLGLTFIITSKNEWRFQKRLI